MNPLSRRKKAPRAATREASDNATTSKEMNVMKNHSTPASQAVALKTKAVAALRESAPVNIRLARYNAAMTKARALEAMGVAQ